MADKYDNAPWMRTAEKYLGTKEIRGSRHNPVVVAFFAKSGHPEIKNDETAWCSAFLNAVMYENGYSGTKSLMARSWLKWKDGEKVTTPRFGDIVIFSRGSDPAFGHVAFFVSWDDEYITVIGGNQSDGVTKARYSRSRLLGFRRPKSTSKTGSPTIPKMTDVPEKKITSTEVVVGAGGALAAVKPLLTGDFYVGLATIVIVVGIVVYIAWKRLST